MEAPCENLRQVDSPMRIDDKREDRCERKSEAAVPVVVTDVVPLDKPPACDLPAPSLGRLMEEVHPDLGYQIRALLPLPKYVAAVGSLRRALSALLGLRAEPGGPPTRFRVLVGDGRVLVVEIHERWAGRPVAGLSGDDGDNFPF